MSMLPSAFKSEEYDDMDSFDALPEGDYNMKIVESSMELTAKAKEAENPKLGQYLKLKFEVLDGKEKGKNFYTNLNLVNTNAKAEEIANKELATMCRAMGKVSITDSAEIHGIPVVVNLKQTGKKEDKYGIQNGVKGYKKYNGEIQPSTEKTAGDGSKSSAKAKKKW